MFSLFFLIYIQVIAIETVAEEAHMMINIIMIKEEKIHILKESLIHKKGINKTRIMKKEKDMNIDIQFMLINYVRGKFF